MNSQLTKIPFYQDNPSPVKVELDNNTYCMVRMTSSSKEKKIYWVWGKTDFVSTFVKEQNVWRCQKILLIKQGKFYEFVEVTGHGIMFEETRWACLDKDLYIELPVHFSNNMIEISRRFLKKVDP